MELQERIQLVMKMNNLSPSSFADKIGVQRSAISHIISGRNRPSLDFIMKILQCFPNISADWLISGVEQPTPVKKETGGPERQTDETHVKAVAGGGNKNIKRIVVFYQDGTFDEYTGSK